MATVNGTATLALGGALVATGTRSVLGTARLSPSFRLTGYRPPPRPSAGFFDRFAFGLNAAIWQNIGTTPPTEGSGVVTFPEDSLVRTRGFFSVEGGYYAVGLTLDPDVVFGVRLETLDVSDGTGYAGLTWRVATDGLGACSWSLVGRTEEGEEIEDFDPADWRRLRIQSAPDDPGQVSFMRSPTGYTWTEVASVTVGVPSLLREVVLYLGGAA